MIDLEEVLLSPTTTQKETRGGRRAFRYSTGDIQIGKTRWLKSTCRKLAADGIPCAGVVAPGVWVPSEHGDANGFEKLGHRQPAPAARRAHSLRPQARPGAGRGNVRPEQPKRTDAAGMGNLRRCDSAGECPFRPHWQPRWARGTPKPARRRRARGVSSSYETRGSQARSPCSTRVPTPPSPTRSSWCATCSSTWRASGSRRSSGDPALVSPTQDAEEAIRRAFKATR